MCVIYKFIFAPVLKTSTGTSASGKKNGFFSLVKKVAPKMSLTLQKFKTFLGLVFFLSAQLSFYNGVRKFYRAWPRIILWLN